MAQNLVEPGVDCSSVPFLTKEFVDNRTASHAVLLKMSTEISLRSVCCLDLCYELSTSVWIAIESESAMRAKKQLRWL